MPKVVYALKTTHFLVAPQFCHFYKKMSSSRTQVLSLFRKLHRTGQRVFRGDEKALKAGRQRINDEFKSKRHVDDINSISELIKYGEDVEELLRTQVIQAQQKVDGNFVLNITEVTTMLDNEPYNDDAVIDKPRPPNKRCKK